MKTRHHKRFVSAEHERRISEFRALDEEFTKVTRQWIRAKLAPWFADSRCAPQQRMGRCATRSPRKQHKPLRQLLEEIPQRCYGPRLAC